LNKPIVNMSASVRQRLLNIAQERKEDFGLVLTKYGLERVLYRIARSKYRDLFILKGALLFELWTQQRYRPTRDADFLARGDNDMDRFIAIFREVCAMPVEDDGLVFEPATVTAEKITEDADYQGIRIRFIGHLENARIPIQIDLGFGDVITPAPVEAELPTLLELPAPKLLTYPRESVIAEKLEALVSLGMVNSRMKDLHDIRSLAQEFSFDGTVLSEAVASTFKRRSTKLPDGNPPVFTSEFSDNAEKKKQWVAFCRKNKSYVEELPLQNVCEEIETFLMPIIRALRADSKFARKWTSKNCWT
jgi:Nucleotidyl transferase AbiEii toxin, Type IV TA system